MITSLGGEIFDLIKLKKMINIYLDSNKILDQYLTYCAYYTVMDAQVTFSDLYGTGKLDGQNYVMWHRKIQFVLHKEKILDHLTNTISMPTELENGPIAQYHRDMDAYNTCVDQNKSTHFTILGYKHGNLIREFEKYPTAKEL